jgi:hypothetical protein
MRLYNTMWSVKQFEIHEEAIRIASADHTRSFLHDVFAYPVNSVRNEHEALNPVVLPRIHLSLHCILHSYNHSRLFP